MAARRMAARSASRRCGTRSRTACTTRRWRRGLRNLYRDHRKLLLVDGRIAWVGGSGATDDFWQPQRTAPSRWHELMVEIHGAVVDDWQTLFERQWQACAGDCAWRPHVRPLAHLPSRPLPGAGLARVAYADAQQHRDILHALLRNLAHARGRIWLATPYFLPGWKVRKALRKAAAVQPGPGPGWQAGQRPAVNVSSF